nr:glycosyltransferase family 4 protein [Lysinibacillus timonensis]
MKILLATYWPVPHVGGVWSYMKQLASKLESYGHEVDILGYDEENLSVRLYSQGRVINRDKVIPIINANINESNYPEMYVNFLVRWTEMQRYVYELSAAYFGLDKYDLIHTQDVISTYCISRIKPKDTPLVATIHGSVAHEIRLQLETVHKTETNEIARAYYDDLEYRGATTPDVTIVCNQWLKNILTSEFNVPEKQIKILHYGFDTEEFIRKSRQQVTMVRPENKKVILYAGRLVELKGVNYLISALSDLRAIRDDWVCWIAGTGEKEEELKLQVRNLDLEKHVIFLGKRDDVPSLLKQTDIFVLPTLIENQPISVIEAQIAGKAVIASDVGGVPEVIQHGVTGLLTPPRNTSMLTNNINLLLANDKLRKTLGANAKKWGMTHWSIDSGMMKIMDIYKGLLRGRKQ